MIELIKVSKTIQEAKNNLIQKEWEPGNIEKYLGVITEMTQDFFPSNNNYGLKKKKYKLSPQQAQAILDLRLQKLTNLEQDKIFDDYKKEIESIKNFIKILTNSDELHKVMKVELEEIKNEYGENRRTIVSSDEGELKKEDLIKKVDALQKSISEYSTRERQMQRAIDNMDKLDS